MLVRENENIWETWSAAQKSDLIHNYVMRYSDRNSRKMDYGTGEHYTAVEVHILEKIYFHPGITVTELAELTSRTKGAASQIVAKLYEKELITKVPQEDDAKKRSLLITPKGEQLNKFHMDYDERMAKKFFGIVSQYYSSEQMDAFFKVMETSFLLLSPSSEYSWLHDDLI